MPSAAYRWHRGGDIEDLIMLSDINSGFSGVLALFSGGIGPWEVVVILVALLLLFGGKKLPDLAKGLGRGLRNFKEELHGVKNDIDAPPELDDQSRPKKKRKKLNKKDA